MPPPSPLDPPDPLTPLIEAVSGLEQAVTGIAAILEGHGHMLGRLLDSAEEPPPEETETHRLLQALIGRLDRQQQTLNRIEMGINAFTDALRKASEEG